MSQTRSTDKIQLTGCSESERRDIINSGMLPSARAASALSPLATRTAELALNTPPGARTDGDDGPTIIIEDDEDSAEQEETYDTVSADETRREDAGEREWDYDTPPMDPTPPPPVISPIVTEAGYDYPPTTFKHFFSNTWYEMHTIQDL